MARILLTATLFFLTFSPHLMAAEAQLKKPTPGALPLTPVESAACVTAFEKCKKVHDDAKNSDDLASCKTACKEAEEKCRPQQNTLKAKTDLSNTNFQRARNFRQSCGNNPLSK